MSVSCIVENTAFDYSMYSEHGLSLLIASDRRKILFDMRQSDVLPIMQKSSVLTFRKLTLLFYLTDIMTTEKEPKDFLS